MDMQTASLIVAIASLIVTAIGSIYIPLHLHKKTQEKLPVASRGRTKKKR